VRIKAKHPTLAINGRYTDHARWWRAAAVVEHDIDRPQLFARGLDGAFDTRPISEIGSEAMRATTSRFNFGNRAIEGLAISREYRDRCAFCGESVGDAASDTFATAENECRFSAELKIHRQVPREHVA